jgi:hypothetical protein
MVKLHTTCNQENGCAKKVSKGFYFIFWGKKNMAQFRHISSEKNSQIIVFRH